MTRQHPEFDRFKLALAEARHGDALHCLDILLGEYPQSLALHWHRAGVLETLGRNSEALMAVDRVLALRADFVPAMIKRAQFDVDGDDEDFEDEEDDEESPEAVLARNERAARQRAHIDYNMSLLRRALIIEPESADAHWHLSLLLRATDPESAAAADHRAEADQLLDRAITLAPDRVEFHEQRAESARMASFLFEHDEDTAPHDDADVIVNASGMRHSRTHLQRALTDYQTCARLSGSRHHALRVAGMLHQLQRHDEALAAYDKVLAAMAADDPQREAIVSMRARSENNGAGEREQMAQALESVLGNLGRDRNLNEDIAAQALMSAAGAVRRGKRVGEAIDARLSDDPEQLMANNIALQILNVANEPAPELVAADAASFPSFQRRFHADRKRALTALGLHHVADAEALGMTRMLGQRILLGFHADEQGETGVASFAMKPKWPGWLGFIVLFFSGKWKTVEMVECVSQFDDGAHLSTQFESPSPFEYAAPVYVEKLPRKASLTELVTRHRGRTAEYQRAHPDSSIVTAIDLAGFEQRWIEGQRSKQAYRASIGYVTDKELKALLGSHHDRFAPKVRERLRVLAEDL